MRLLHSCPGFRARLCPALASWAGATRPRVARGRGSRAADPARGRGSRGAGRRPPATLPTLEARVCPAPRAPVGDIEAGAPPRAPRAPYAWPARTHSTVPGRSRALVRSATTASGGRRRSGARVARHPSHASLQSQTPVRPGLIPPP